jgi:hypothetical protein
MLSVAGVLAICLKKGVQPAVMVSSSHGVCKESHQARQILTLMSTKEFSRAGAESSCAGPWQVVLIPPYSAHSAASLEPVTCCQESLGPCRAAKTHENSTVAGDVQGRLPFSKIMSTWVSHGNPQLASGVWATTIQKRAKGDGGGSA